MSCYKFHRSYWATASIGLALAPVPPRSPTLIASFVRLESSVDVRWIQRVQLDLRLVQCHWSWTNP